MHDILIKEFNDFCVKMNESTSSNAKIEVIKQVSEDLKKVLYYTYNPYYHFGVSSKNLHKRNDLVQDNVFLNVFDMLDLLRKRNITGHAAISMLNGFIATNKGSSDLIYKILDKDLKIRSGVKSISKAFPDLIPEFNVALADTFNEKTQKKINFDRQWFLSRKLDGVRCITIIDENGDISFFSRAGKEFLTLSKIADEIKALNLTSTVLDGEVCKFKHENNEEDFQGIIKEIRRKNHTIDNVTYYMFDMLSMKDFTKKKSDVKFSVRLSNLNNTLSSKSFKHLKVLKQDPVFSLEEMNVYIDDFKKDKNRNNWEGLIARKDTIYQGKRSRDILKVKTFFDAEYVVKSVIFGPFRHVVDHVEVEAEMLSAVVVEHKGNEVQVGSGFSIEQRQYYHKYPEDILNKTITVQYFEESQNQLGEYSLRFPVIKNIFKGERDM